MAFFLKKEFLTLEERGQYTRDPVLQTATSSAYFMGVLSEQSKSIFGRLPSCYAAGLCFGCICHQDWRDLDTSFGGTVWDLGEICNSFYQELVHNAGVRQEDKECFFGGFLSIFAEVVEYEIHLHMGDLKKVDATGEVYLRLQGEKSDSGKQWLNSKNSLITFARGQVKLWGKT